MPPFKPNVAESQDVKYFEREFLEMPVVNSEGAEARSFRCPHVTMCQLRACEHDEHREAMLLTSTTSRALPIRAWSRSMVLRCYVLLCPHGDVVALCAPPQEVH
eukprot:2700112-Amphidinium_carterae.2